MARRAPFPLSRIPAPIGHSMKLLRADHVPRERARAGGGEGGGGGEGALAGYMLVLRAAAVRRIYPGGELAALGPARISLVRELKGRRLGWNDSDVTTRM